MKTRIKILALFLVILFPLLVLASPANVENKGKGEGSQQVQDSKDTTGVNGNSQAIEVRNQNQNRSEGEVTESKNREQIQEEIQERVKEIKNEVLFYNPRSEVAREHFSNVAKEVEELIRNSAQFEGGIGEKVREVARSQVRSMKNVCESLDKVKERLKFTKFIIGPNFKELKKTKEELNQYRLNIQVLQQLLAQIKNSSEKEQLENQIQVLQREISGLENQIKAEENQFSLFGWLFKIISRY